MTSSDPKVSPAGRVLNAATPALRPTIRRLLEEPPARVAMLQDAVYRHLRILEGAAASHPTLDIVTARKVACRCQALLDGPPPNSVEGRRLVQVAARYFIEHDDADNDVDSPTGFDDDLEVVTLIAREIGRKDVLEIG